MKFKCEKGFTLVETLCAIAVLLGVLIPLLLFLGKLGASRMVRDKIIAQQLAREELERCETFRLTTDEDRWVAMDHRYWRIRRQIWNREGLLELKVLIYKGQDNSPLVIRNRLELPWNE